MRERTMALLAVWVLVLGLCGCRPSGTAEGGGSTEPELTYLDYYDLGVRYLSEGNYEEAIIAFTAAIEIDPKQAPAYVGRGDAHVLSGEMEENLAAAKVDYETAIELDETNAGAYLGLANVYIRQGDYEKALEILRQGSEKTGNGQDIENKISEILDKEGKNKYGATAFTNRSGYVAYENMPSEQQSLIEQIADAAVKNDTESLYSILRSVDLSPLKNQWGGYTYIYTMWNGHKTMIWANPNHIDEDGDETGELQITLRPENGKGIYCVVYYSFAEITEGRESWFDYYYHTTYITCECADWQWNGFLEKTEQGNSLWRSNDNSTCLSTEEVAESGRIVNSLKVGEFTQGKHEISDWEPHDDADHEVTTTTVSLYQDGILMERNGEAVESSGISVLEGFTVDSNAVLDNLYW